MKGERKRCSSKAYMRRVVEVRAGRMRRVVRRVGERVVGVRRDIMDVDVVG